MSQAEEEDMANKIRVTVSAVLVSSVFALLSSLQSAAQEQLLREEYQAQAMGQGTQMGQTFNVTLHVDEYSSMDERQALIEAFDKSGSQGLFNALNKMHAKGHIAITGTLGYDVSFARKIQTPDGWKIRILTNRPITFGEAWTDSRSMDYNLSALELDISDQKGKSTGLLLPASEFVIDKKSKELTMANYQNPWKLVDVLDRSKR
jgi:hypothetical protein